MCKISLKHITFFNLEEFPKICLDFQNIAIFANIPFIFKSFSQNRENFFLFGVAQWLSQLITYSIASSSGWRKRLLRDRILSDSVIFFFFFFLSRYQVRAQLQSTLNYFNFSSVIRMFGEGHPLSRYAELLLIVLIRCIIGSKSLPPGYGLWAHTHTHTHCVCCVNRSDTWKEIMNGRQAGEWLERASITEEEIAVDYNF